MDTSKFTSQEGRLCLDFANTLQQDTEGNSLETLNQYADLVAWGWKYEILPTEDSANHLLEIAARQPQAAQSALEKAIQLRDLIFRIFSTSSDGCTPEADDIEWLNAYLVEALVWLRIRPSDSGCYWSWADSGNDLEKVWYPVVWSAANLLNSDDLARVRECASETCTWLFVDTSKNHSRRWCSMKSCGNRDKVRRYLQRQRDEP